MEELNETYPKREYAHRLADNYGLAGKSQSRLVILEALNDIKPLSKIIEIKALVNLHLSNGAPYKAARILDHALKQKVLPVSEQNLKLLGHAWLEAKEVKLALQPLTQAASLSSHGNIHLRIAQIFIDEEKWLDASNWVKEGIRKGNLNSVADANIMLGIILLNQQKLSESRSAFIKAIDTGEKTLLASRWLKYIDRL
jgi:tetratricopeptide (TPR) repeat protein